MVTMIAIALSQPLAVVLQAIPLAGHLARPTLVTPAW